MTDKVVKKPNETVENINTLSQMKSKWPQIFTCGHLFNIDFLSAFTRLQTGHVQQPLQQQQRPSQTPERPDLRAARQELTR